MVVKNTRSIVNARRLAMIARRRGFKASVFKKKRGIIGVSVTR